jgi:hypothetical protein
MKTAICTASAAIVLLTLAGSAYAVDPATNAMSEAEAIHGAGPGPAGKTGAGATEATDAMLENQAIEGSGSGVSSKVGAGPNPASDARSENRAIQGHE